MKCSICHTNIKIYEFDLYTAFNDYNPLTFRKSNMHSDCYNDALDQIEEEPSNKVGFQNRLDEFLCFVSK
jgi:hypothetical protein